MSELKIPGFEILEKIGEGGMATVWKARQVSLDRVVAIKMLSSQEVHDPSDVQRFQSEAQRAAKLKHPGIIQVYDANALGGVYYYVMEHVAGYTVGDWVRRKGRLTEGSALLVADSVADALDYAWQAARIIHCDIKPDNVMVDADGTVKLADLGLSRTLNAMARSEVSDEVMGTPAYISPEQAMGEPDLDSRADMYSLGAMLYHLVTGQLLFQGEPEDKVMELQVTGKVADPVELNPVLSRNIGWLIEKMLSKKREHRHKDWGAIRADIARIRKGYPIRPPLPPDGSSTVTRSVRRVKVQPQPVGFRRRGASALPMRDRGACPGNEQAGSAGETRASWFSRRAWGWFRVVAIPVFLDAGLSLAAWLRSVWCRSDVRFHDALPDRFERLVVLCLVVVPLAAGTSIALSVLFPKTMLLLFLVAAMSFLVEWRIRVSLSTPVDDEPGDGDEDANDRDEAR